MPSAVQTYRASWVLPISAPPIENGEVVIAEGRIAEVRPSAGSAAASVRDFGDAILMPGLVNVHTHLDYTVMRGLLEDVEFFPWVRELNFRKAALDADDWLASATWGAAEAVAGGVTTIGECTDTGAALDGARTLGLGGVVYQEVFGIDEARPVEAIVEELAGRVAQLQARAEGTRLAVGVSPHAPYTVRPALFRALATWAAERGLRICIHAAESNAESELIRSGTGAFAAMFDRRGIAWDPPGASVVAYLDSLGALSSRTLLVHGVQLCARDAGLTADRGVAWAHCPKSNAKLGNGVAPLGLLLHVAGGADAGRPAPRIGLGSDSVASNNTMDLFEEMRFAVLMQRAARRRIDALTAREAVEMATVGGARALGLDGETGTIEVGKRADLCAVALGDLHAAPAYDPYSALVYAAGARDVLGTLIGGELRYDRASENHRFPGVELRPIRRRLREAVGKMRDWRPGER